MCSSDLSGRGAARRPTTPPPPRLPSAEPGSGTPGRPGGGEGERERDGGRGWRGTLRDAPGGRPGDAPGMVGGGRPRRPEAERARARGSMAASPSSLSLALSLSRSLALSLSDTLYKIYRTIARALSLSLTFYLWLSLSLILDHPLTLSLSLHNIYVGR